MAAGGRFQYETPFAIGPLPEAGLSDREIIKRENTLDWILPASTAALARGDITVIREQLDELLYAFQCNLDRKSVSYRKLGMAVLAAHVKALKDIRGAMRARLSRHRSGPTRSLAFLSGKKEVPFGKP
jgi:hypothetical protein